MAPLVEVSVMPCCRRLAVPKNSPTNAEHRRIRSPTHGSSKADCQGLASGEGRGRRRSLTHPATNDEVNKHESLRNAYSAAKENRPHVNVNVPNLVAEDRSKVPSKLMGPPMVCQPLPATNILTGTDTVMRFLPLNLNGVDVLTLEGNTKYRADNSLFRADTSGLVYRISKKSDDWDREKEFLTWGNTITGTDEGDGWIRCELRKGIKSVTPAHGLQSKDVSHASRQRLAPARTPLQVIPQNTTDVLATSARHVREPLKKSNISNLALPRRLEAARSLHKSNMCAEERAEKFNQLIFEKLAGIWSEYAARAKMHTAPEDARPVIRHNSDCYQK